jgi:hypothetical protein
MVWCHPRAAFRGPDGALRTPHTAFGKTPEIYNGRGGLSISMLVPRLYVPAALVPACYSNALRVPPASWPRIVSTLPGSSLTLHQRPTVVYRGG